MTDQDWIDLGRRAVACKGWRWMPGMSLIRRKSGPAGGTGLRLTHLRVALTCGHPCDPFAAVADVDRLWRPVPDDPHWVPDFRDPATLGCLLALVREVLGEPLASVEVRQPGDLGCRACVRVPVGSEGWRVVQWWRASQDPQYAEAAALVSALEAADE